MRIRDTVLVKGAWVSSNYWKGEPLEESRQHYANVRIQEFQRAFPKAAFPEVLHAFRYYGMVYDQGFRLHDPVEGAV